MIISNQELRTKVEAQLPSDHQFDFVAFSSIADFFERSTNLKLCGIVADVKTMISPSPFKTELLTLSEVFPFLRLRAETGGALTGSVASENYHGSQMWDAFLTKFAGPFPLRSRRGQIRQAKFIPIEYRFESEPADSYRRSYTFDLSATGLYIIATDARSDLKSLWLRLPARPTTELKLKIAWANVWEKASNSKPAGFGLQLDPEARAVLGFF